MFVYERAVQYYETDKMSIVHHSNYIRWMEEARIAFLGQAGLPYVEMEAAGVVSPVVSLSIAYKQSCRFGDRIRIAVWADSYNGFRLCVGYRMTNSVTGATVAEARSQHCLLREGRVCSLRKELPAMHEHLTHASEERNTWEEAQNT